MVVQSDYGVSDFYRAVLHSVAAGDYLETRRERDPSVMAVAKKQIPIVLSGLNEGEVESLMAGIMLDNSGVGRPKLVSTVLFEKFKSLFPEFYNLEMNFNNSVLLSSAANYSAPIPNSINPSLDSIYVQSLNEKVSGLTEARKEELAQKLAKYRSNGGASKTTLDTFLVYSVGQEINGKSYLIDEIASRLRKSSDPICGEDVSSKNAGGIVLPNPDEENVTSIEEKSLESKVGSVSSLSKKEKVMNLSNRGYSPKEIASELGLKVSTVYIYKSAASKKLSGGSTKELSLEEKVAGEEVSESALELENEILYITSLIVDGKKLEGLSKRENKVLKMLAGYGFDKEYNKTEIAKMLSVSTSSVSKIKKKALTKLGFYNTLEPNEVNLGDVSSKGNLKQKAISHKSLPVSSAKYGNDDYVSNQMMMNSIRTHCDTVSMAEEQALFSIYRKDLDPKVKNKIISANVKFVVKVALEYRGCPIPLPELVNEGCMGLIRAAESFDHTRGLKFISYAVWWAKAYITRAINEQGSLIQIPANQNLKVRKALNERKETVTNEIRELLNLGGIGDSFDSPLRDGSKTTLSDVLTDTNACRPDNYVEVGKTEQFVKELLSELSEKETKVLKGLYGLSGGRIQTLREVGESLNLSHECIRQLRDKALTKLKSGSRKIDIRKKLDSYLTATN